MVNSFLPLKHKFNSISRNGNMFVFKSSKPEGTIEFFIKTNSPTRMVVHSIILISAESILSWGIPGFRQCLPPGCLRIMGNVFPNSSSLKYFVSFLTLFHRGMVTVLFPPPQIKACCLLKWPFSCRQIHTFFPCGRVIANFFILSKVSSPVIFLLFK